MGGWRTLGGMLFGIVLGMAIGWQLWHEDAPGMPRWAGFQDGADAVLIVVVESPGDLDAVRGAVAEDRIVARSDTGFAVAPQRIVVSALEQAGELLTTAGWQDRPLEIVDLGRREREQDVPDERIGRIAALMSKPTLTRSEAYLLLGSM